MISETNQATLQADGDSAWVPLGPDGSVVTVDCVDSNGVSQSWGGASVALLYSPDGLMRAAAEENGTAITGKTDGFAKSFSRGGFVAMAVSSYSAGTMKLVVS